MPEHEPQTQQHLQQQILLDHEHEQQRIENHGPLYRQQPDPRTLHGVAPSYPQAASKERPKATGKAGETYDRPFSLTAAAFVTGLGLGIAGAAFMYIFSGAHRIMAHATQDRKQLAKRRAELFGLRSDRRARTFDERREWFEMCARNYAAFVPGTHAYLATTLPDIGKAESTGADGQDKVDKIIQSCAAELQKLSMGANADLLVGREAWRILHEHLERIVDLAEEGRSVPGDVRYRVQERLAALRKIGTRVGREERRAMEEEELAKPAASTAR